MSTPASPVSRLSSLARTTIRLASTWSITPPRRPRRKRRSHAPRCAPCRYRPAACQRAGRHSLTLHVRTHQRTVGVIVLQERNQRRGNRNDLLRRHVHQGDVFRALTVNSPMATNGHQLINQHFPVVHRSRSLGDHVVAFDGGQEDDPRR